MTLQSMSREQSVSQIASVQGQTEESLTDVQKVPVLLKAQGTELEKFTNVANTLMARDYKGFGNKGMNGVIEWK